MKKYFNQNISILCRLSSACQVLFLTLSSAGKKVSSAFLALTAENDVSDGGCKYISEGRHFLFLIFCIAPLTVGGHSSLQDNRAPDDEKRLQDGGWTIHFC